LESEKFNPDSASFAYFDFSGIVNVEITPLDIDIQKVIIRPLSKGIIPEVDNGIISFSLDKPQKLSVEINGNSTNNLMLFANEIEKNKPDPTDPNTIYFGPGISFFCILQLSIPVILVPVLSLTDVGNWELWSQAGWQYILGDKKVYIMLIENKGVNLIESIEIKSESMDEVPVILAITTGV
jgi:hypothetical protein